MLQQALASVFEGPGKPLQLRSIPLPTLGEGEILVRVGLTTICGSDLHSFDGRREVPVPTILGHEILGSVVDFGPRAPQVDSVGRPLAIGDRVTWSLVVSCGECFYCQRDLPEKCAHVVKYGHERATDTWALNGGLATHCHLRKGTHVFRLPESLPATVACPASCATATVAAALRHAGEPFQRRAEPRERSESTYSDPLRGSARQALDQVVLVQGAGMLGVTAAAWAKVRGARHVIVADPSQQRLETARLFGADAVFSLADDELRRHVNSATDGRGIDLVLEMSGAADAVMLGVELLRPGGRAVWVGAVFPTTAKNFVAERIVRKYLTIQGVHNYRPADLAAALDFLTAHHGSFPFAELVSRPFSLAEAELAFLHARQGTSFRVAVRSDS